MVIKLYNERFYNRLLKPRRDRRSEAEPSAPEKTSQGAGSYVVLALLFLVGVALMAYPTVSNFWNSLHLGQAILEYTEIMAGLSDEEYQAYYQAAVDYNNNMQNRMNMYRPSPEESAAYYAALNIDGSGIMGIINIPAINVNIPIYHGTEERVLQMAVGHLAWTSLPIGGEGTHAVLSGHRGLPSARLFTDLDKLVVGDVFTLNILDETLTYEIDQILIVLPEDVGPLKVIPGEDHCTLVTCTPYGINTHRILVRGTRIENAREASNVRITADGVQIEEIFVAPVVAVPLLVILMTFLFMDDRRGPGDTAFDETRDWDALVKQLTEDWGFQEERRKGGGGRRET